MQTIRHWRNQTEASRGASVAMGNFDGVHRGHQSVIDLARGHGAPLGLITFEPHPREYFAPDAPPFRLMNAEARANRLDKLGVEWLFELPFDAELAAMTPEEFVTEVLVKGLGVAHVAVGGDFRFGKGRAAGADELVELGKRHGFAVTIAPLLHHEGVEVSSTAIRNALAEGRPEEANEMLGHLHRIEGAVLHGAKKGRELGFPTANMALERLHMPKLGVYAVKCDVLSGPHAGSYIGAANLGISPMFEGRKPTLETYLFDFAGDLYGAHLSVALVFYLRPEKTFSNLDALIDQMKIDCGRARELLVGAHYA